LIRACREVETAACLDLLTKGPLGRSIVTLMNYHVSQAAQYLCPAIFPWVDRGPATEASGRYVMKLVGILYGLILIFDLIIVCGMGEELAFFT